MSKEAGCIFITNSEMLVWDQQNLDRRGHAETYLVLTL